jgi:hypothetical protein
MPLHDPNLLLLLFMTLHGVHPVHSSTIPDSIQGSFTTTKTYERPIHEIAISAKDIRAGSMQCRAAFLKQMSQSISGTFLCANSKLGTSVKPDTKILNLRFAFDKHGTLQVAGLDPEHVLEFTHRDPPVHVD